MRFLRFGNPQSSREKDGILQVERSRTVRPLQQKTDSWSVGGIL
jgi:virulence-associated protein VagC